MNILGFEVPTIPKDSNQTGVRGIPPSRQWPVCPSMFKTTLRHSASSSRVSPQLTVIIQSLSWTSGPHFIRRVLATSNTIQPPVGFGGVHQDSPIKGSPFRHISSFTACYKFFFLYLNTISTLPQLYLNFISTLSQHNLYTTLHFTDKWSP